MPRARGLRPLLILLVTACLASCGQPDEQPAPSSGEASGAASSTSTAAPSPSASSSSGTATPSAIEGLDRYAWRFSELPGGQSALVGTSAGFFPRTRTSRIVEPTAPDGEGWRDPTPVTFSTGDTADLDPFVTADGARVWFSSIRPVDGADRRDTDLWYVDRLPDGSFGEPVNPGPVVNSQSEDLYPTVAPDGALWFASDRGGAGFDIWHAAPAAGGGWQAPQPLREPVNTSGSWEFNPALTPDGGTLVFTALNRPGGAGLGDLWTAQRDGEGWSEPQLLSAVSTSRDEYHPSFSADGSVLYLVRDGRVHEVPWEQVRPSG